MNKEYKDMLSELHFSEEQTEIIDKIGKPLGVSDTMQVLRSRPMRFWVMNTI